MAKPKLKAIYSFDETTAQKKERVIKIIRELKILYPDAVCSLNNKTPHQLLVAAILAAQCTDDRVNMVTPTLFAKYPTIKSFANADQAELEEMVKSTGFFRNKTKAIIESAREIIANFNGKLPETMEELTSLTGVGRKTANLLMGDAFGKPAVVVDTHVKRISGRLGLTTYTDPEKIEQDLWKILPTEDSTNFNHLIVYHGRAVCKAPNPFCERCQIIKLCPCGQSIMNEKP